MSWHLLLPYGLASGEEAGRGVAIDTETGAAESIRCRRTPPAQTGAGHSIGCTPLDHAIRRMSYSWRRPLGRVRLKSRTALSDGVCYRGDKLWLSPKLLITGPLI